MNRSLLRRIYKRYQIVKRPIKYSKQFKYSKTKKRVVQLQEMIQNIEQAKQEGYRIVYLDE